jgi:hypothetical protein
VALVFNHRRACADSHLEAYSQRFRRVSNVVYLRLHKRALSHRLRHEAPRANSVSNSQSLHGGAFLKAIIVLLLKRCHLHRQWLWQGPILYKQGPLRFRIHTNLPIHLSLPNARSLNLSRNAEDEDSGSKRMLRRAVRAVATSSADLPNLQLPVNVGNLITSPLPFRMKPIANM